MRILSWVGGGMCDESGCNVGLIEPGTESEGFVIRVGGYEVVLRERWE